MDQMPEDELGALVRRIPEGWSRITVDGAPWRISRATRAGGKVVSLEAELLGGADRLGANVWLTSGGAILKPCEVPRESVLNVIRAAASE